MAFQTAQVPFKLSPQDMGRPDILGSISKGLQVGYQPAMAQADIFHKTLSPLAAIATNPQLWGLMSKEQQQNISNLIGNMMPNGGQMPGQNQGILSSLLGNIFGGQSQGAPSLPSGQPSSMGQAATPSQGAPSYPQQEQSYPGNVPQTDFNRNAQGFVIPGTTGPANPMGIATAAQKGYETSATTQAAGQTEQWNQMIKEGKDAGQAAASIQANLDKVYEGFKNLEPAEKGPGFGRVVALSTAAQDVDQGSTAIADSLAAAQQSGHITQADRQVYGGMKPGRYSTDENMSHQREFISGVNLRLNQITPFTIASRKVGLAPEEATAVWQYYVSKTPIYNNKTHKLNPKIMDWESFLTPKKINEALHPSFRESDEKNGISNSGNVANILNKSDKTKKEGIANVEGVIQESKNEGGEQVVRINNQWYHVR